MVDQVAKVTVVGTGIMGEGIANAIFRQGFEVNIFDLEESARERALANIHKQARRTMDKSKIKTVSSLETAAKESDLIIEAIVENMDVKKKLFADLNKWSPEHTLLASNTSSLDIDEMAQGSGRPQQFFGLHFFNPAQLMRLVEIITPKEFNQDTYKLVADFVKNIRKTAVKCQNSPGFVVNRILIPLINEAFELLEAKSGGDPNQWIAVANDMDSAIVKENILVMGPFDLMDLTGLETANAVANVIYNGFQQSSRYEPPKLLQKLVAEKRFGRKNGRGIYCYGNNANDPDANPRLDDSKNPITPVENPAFQTVDLVTAMVNESLRVLEEGIVDNFRDIETCMELGTRWPNGPFALAKKFGVANLQARLEEKYQASGQHPRYEPSKLWRDIPAELHAFFNEA